MKKCEHPLCAAFGDHVEIRHAAPEQWASFAETVVDVQPTIQQLLAQT